MNYKFTIKKIKTVKTGHLNSYYDSIIYAGKVKGQYSEIIFIIGINGPLKICKLKILFPEEFNFNCTLARCRQILLKKIEEEDLNYLMDH